MKERNRATGAAAFQSYYSGIYGERWPALAAALQGPSDSVEFDAGGGRPYRLDSGSILAAESLVLPGEGEILDACAAPGGKSLVLASRMGPSLRLVANELSSDRRRRLGEALDASLAPAVRQRVAVAGEDAGAMCRRNAGRFGAVLLDAPCSSERHVLADAAALAEWSPARPRQLAMRQWALLSSAFLMLKSGGCLVYSTCALDPAENDGVAARLAAKYGGSLRFDPPRPGRGEPTAYGLLVAPDRDAGAGPMYVCRVFKA
ncbi:MAG: 16S rRNA methyltransferase [Spirochaetaceae bacterium]|nr:16S rRNA methyltransferase [Spirochaetaceae bacterium]